MRRNSLPPPRRYNSGDHRRPYSSNSSNKSHDRARNNFGDMRHRSQQQQQLQKQKQQGGGYNDRRRSFPPPASRRYQEDRHSMSFGENLPRFHPKLAGRFVPAHRVAEETASSASATKILDTNTSTQQPPPGATPDLTVASCSSESSSGDATGDRFLMQPAAAAATTTTTTTMAAAAATNNNSNNNQRKPPPPVVVQVVDRHRHHNRRRSPPKKRPIRFGLVGNKNDDDDAVSSHVAVTTSRGNKAGEGNNDGRWKNADDDDSNNTLSADMKKEDQKNYENPEQSSLNVQAGSSSAMMKMRRKSKLLKSPSVVDTKSSSNLTAVEPLKVQNAESLPLKETDKVTRNHQQQSELNAEKQNISNVKEDATDETSVRFQKAASIQSSVQESSITGADHTRSTTTKEAALWGGGPAEAIKRRNAKVETATTTTTTTNTEQQPTTTTTTTNTEQQQQPTTTTTTRLRKKQQPRKDCQDVNLVTLGSRVAVYWDGEKTYFRGTVTRCRKKKHFVEYDDGDREWIRLSKHRFRLLKKRARSSRTESTNDESSPKKKKEQQQRSWSGEEKNVLVDSSSAAEDTQSRSGGDRSSGEEVSTEETKSETWTETSDKEEVPVQNHQVDVMKSNGTDAPQASKQEMDEPQSMKEACRDEASTRRNESDAVMSKNKPTDTAQSSASMVNREDDSSQIKEKQVPKKKAHKVKASRRVRRDMNATTLEGDDSSGLGIAEAVKLHTAIRLSLQDAAKSEVKPKDRKKSAKRKEKKRPPRALGESQQDEKMELPSTDRAKRKEKRVSTEERSSERDEESAELAQPPKRFKKDSGKSSATATSPERLTDITSDWVASYNRHIPENSSDDSETDEEELMQWASTMFGIQRPPMARPVQRGVKSEPGDSMRAAAARSNLAASQKRKKNVFRRSESNTSESAAEKEEEARRKKESARPLTAEEVRAILGDDFAVDCPSSNWVRRSVRQPSKNALNSPQVKALLEKLKTDDDDMVVLKMKKYVNDPNAPCIVIDAVLDALEENTNCEALYIQNFNEGLRDEQVKHLIRVLQQPSCKIWCLNIGEIYNVKRRTWRRFISGLKKTKITHIYVSEHIISAEQKEQIRDIIRRNRRKHTMHIDPDNLDTIVKCTHCWWNPINAKVLRPYLKRRGYESILQDTEAQGLRGSTSGATLT